MKFKFHKLVFFILVIFLLSEQLISQIQSKNWVFGENNSMVFTSTGAPTVVTPNANNNFNTFEGSTVCSNGTGNMLFYSNGSKLFKSNHTLVTLSPALAGHPSSTSSSITIPFPGVTTDYLLISTFYGDGANSGPLDIRRLRNNAGNITQISSDSKQGAYCERLAAVVYRDKCDFILGVSKRLDNTSTTKSNIEFYLVNPSGVGTSMIGIIPNIISTHGYMKFSHDGEYFAVMSKSEATVYRVSYSYPNLTFTLLTKITGGTFLYGCEFTRDNKFLYFSEMGTSNSSSILGSIYRLPLPGISTSPNLTLAGMSQYLIKDKIPNPNNYRYSIGALQIHPFADEIFIASDGDNYLHKISGASGATPIFTPQAVNLQNRSFLGLPTFVSGIPDCSQPPLNCCNQVTLSNENTTCCSNIKTTCKVKSLSVNIIGGTAINLTSSCGPTNQNFIGQSQFIYNPQSPCPIDFKVCTSNSTSKVEYDITFEDGSTCKKTAIMECGVPDATYSTCCPPINKEDIKQMFNPVFQSGASGPYKMIFNPTQQFKNLMQAYINLLNLTCSSKNLNFAWQLCDMGNGNQPGSGYCNNAIEQKYTSVTVGGNGSFVPNNSTIFFNSPNSICQPNRWYRITLGIYPDTDKKCFDLKCSDSLVMDFRWQMMTGKTNQQPLLEILGHNSVPIKSSN